MQRDVAARRRRRPPARRRLGLEVDARVGNGGELRRNAALDLDAGPLAILAEGEVEAALPTFTRSTTFTTSGARWTISRARVEASSACARVEPGGRKMRTVLKSRFCVGMKVKESCEKRKPVRASVAMPPPPWSSDASA
jgi:hypothetical protein